MLLVHVLGLHRDTHGLCEPDLQHVHQQPRLLVVILGDLHWNTYVLCESFFHHVRRQSRLLLVLVLDQLHRNADPVHSTLHDHLPQQPGL